MPPVPPAYKLLILQQPDRARACGVARLFAGRRTIDPPPVVAVALECGNQNVVDHCLSHIVMLVHAELENCTGHTPTLRATPLRLRLQDALYGETMISATIVSPEIRAAAPPLRAIKDLKAFFMFTDLSVRYEGVYRLQFSLFELPVIDSETLIFRGSITSEPFRVYTAKDFPGLLPSTELDQALKALGSRVRIRKITGTKRGSLGLRKVRKDEPKQSSSSPQSSNYSRFSIHNLLNPEPEDMGKDLLTRSMSPFQPRRLESSYNEPGLRLVLPIGLNKEMVSFYLPLRSQYFDDNIS